MGTFFKDDDVTILSNPTAARLKAFLSQSGYRCLRGILDDSGDLYVWDANHMTHSDLAFDFGISGLRVDISEDAVFVVLAGGAHELMVPPDNLETFFEGHGHPGASLEESDVLAGICDAACLTVRSHRSFKGIDPKGIVADIDPRLHHGRTNLSLVREMNSGYGQARSSR